LASCFPRTETDHVQPMRSKKQKIANEKERERRKDGEKERENKTQTKIEKERKRIKSYSSEVHVKDSESVLSKTAIFHKKEGRKCGISNESARVSSLREANV